MTAQRNRLGGGVETQGIEKKNIHTNGGGKGKRRGGLKNKRELERKLGSGLRVGAQGRVGKQKNGGTSPRALGQEMKVQSKCRNGNWLGVQGPTSRTRREALKMCGGKGKSDEVNPPIEKRLYSYGEAQNKQRRAEGKNKGGFGSSKGPGAFPRQMSKFTETGLVGALAKKIMKKEWRFGIVVFKRKGSSQVQPGGVEKERPTNPGPGPTHLGAWGGKTGSRATEKIWWLRQDKGGNLRAHRKGN